VCSSTATGLSGEPGDVALRRRLYGANALPPAAASSLWQLILEAASDTTLLLLLAAGGVSLGLSAARAAEIADWIDGAAILASVGICVAVTAGTNYNKEAKFRALNALKEDVQVGGWVWWWWGGAGGKGTGAGAA
jgi:magnesium-transporting ATPase (P-type)